VPLDSVVLMQDLQVRRKLNPGAVKRYAEMHKAGQVAPPPLVARVQGEHGPVLYLVDGWHRWEANALQIDEYQSLVLVKVSPMDLNAARWEAAKANQGHGVPLKPGELRKVLGAFIKAGMHWTGRGEVMSYRELGEVVGKGHTTIYNWVRLDHPKLAKRMGGAEGGNLGAGLTQHGAPESPAAAHHWEAMAALKRLDHHAVGTCPQGRHEVLQELHRLSALVAALGTDPRPPTEDY